ncbi:MAG TPA: phosphate ABC transporter substrate-binding protein PstS [Pirellulales bacterium]|nr:phosphate ABC transporter substrate-binding protein PstS [Pirellulales bacterium]
MKPIFVSAAVALCAVAGCSGSDSTTIHGAGASFPYPIYSKWAYTFEQLDGARINYQSIGSSAGINQVKDRTVNFGASDAPLDKKELDAAGLVQFPLVIGGIVPVVHLSGVKAGELKLSPEVLANIFLGEITKWNDSAIVALNPDGKLPDVAITPVRRSDGSGTTWIYTNYLSAVSSPWKERIGAGKEVSWPAASVGGKGNEGVAANVTQIDGSIGYVEYAYAVQNKMTHVQLQNKAGKFVEPSLEAFSAAAKNADWAGTPGFAVALIDQPGDDTWPIVGASFILLHNDQPDRAVAAKMLKFFDWCFKHGGDAAKNLHFVPIPADVYTLVEADWDKQIQSGGKPIER